MKTVLSVLFILWICLVSSCKKEEVSVDENPYCTLFYFKIISKESGADLVYGSNPVFTGKNDIVACADFTLTLSGNGCSNSGFTGPFLENHTVNGLKTLGSPLCVLTSSGYWSNLKLSIADSLIYKIDYKLMEYETFRKLAPSEHYFLELYINGTLQCAPCKPDHITTFEVDL